MVKLEFTKHGKKRILERRIDISEVLDAIENPVFLYHDISSRTNIAFKKLNKKHLLVSYVREGEKIKVVTTFITSEAQKIISRKVRKGKWVRIK